MWIVLIGFGVAIMLTVATRQSTLVKVITVCITIWQALIYLITALLNPGIASADDDEDSSDLERNMRNPE